MEKNNQTELWEESVFDPARHFRKALKNPLN